MPALAPTAVPPPDPDSDPLRERLLKSAARCLQALTSAPYQACRRAIDTRHSDTFAPEMLAQVLEVVDLIQAGEHTDPDGTRPAFDDLVADVVAATTPHRPVPNDLFDAHTTPLPDGRLAVHWAFDWSTLEVLASATDSTLVAALPTGLRKLPDDPLLTAKRTAAALAQAVGAPDAIQVAERLHAAVARLGGSDPATTGNTLRWLIDHDTDDRFALDLASLGSLTGEQPGDLPDVVIGEVAHALDTIGSLLGGAAVGALSGLAAADLMALLGTESGLVLRAADGATRPVRVHAPREASALARSCGVPVEVLRPLGAVEVVWLTCRPCVCPCHQAKLTGVQRRDWHGNSRAAACPCKRGFSHLKVELLQFGDEVLLDDDDVRHIVSARWQMDDYDGSGLVVLECAEPDRGQTHQTVPDVTMVWARR